MKRLVILQAVVMLTFIAFWSGQAVAAILVVDDDGAECPGAGFTTITAALTAASPNSKIEVCPGVYNEAVVISSNGITLKGKPAPGAILDGTGLGGATGIRILAGVSRVTIEDLEIRLYDDRGIRGLGTPGMPNSNIKLINLDIHAVSQVGGLSDGHAIDFVHAAHVKIQDVTVAVGPGAGLFAEAIRLQSVNPVTVDNVHIVGGFVGVNFACSGPCVGPEPPTNGIIKHSTISGTTDNGVLLANTTRALIDGNVIAGAAFAGIQVGFRVANPVTGAQIFNNVITDTQSGGLGAGIALIRGSGGSTVKNNIVTGSFLHGILVGTSSGNTIDHNVSNGNSGFGYRDDETGAGNVFFQNECKANTLGGSSPVSLCSPQM